jgi:ketopantoate hydroxymethyltransferase
MVSKKLFVVFLGLMLISLVSAWSVDITKLNGATIESDYDVDVTNLHYQLTGINCSQVQDVLFSDDGGVTNTSKGGCAESGGEVYLPSLMSNQDTNDWMIIVENFDNTTETSSVNFWVDSIYPTITINSPSAVDYFSTLTLNFDVDIYEVNPEPFTQFAIYNSAGVMMWSWAYNLVSGANSIIDSANPMPSDGTYTFNVTAQDTLGHVSKTSRVVIMDSVPPVASIDAPINGSLHNGDVLIQTSATDNLAGIDTIEIEVDGAPMTTCSSDTCDYTLDTTSLADGFHEINATATDKAGNTHEVTITIETDNTAPVITLLGSNPQAIEVFDSYIEQGATADDARDGNLTTSIVIDSSIVDTNVLGNYPVTYTVSDIVGNVAQVNRTVGVIDTTAPVITLIGSDPQQVEFNTSYVEQGATASDNYDGDLSASIVINSSAIDVNTIGNYTVTYDVIDSSGNPAIQVTRTVEVIDSTPPVLTLLGDNPQTVEVFTAYVEQGATADDNYDGDLTVNITIDDSAVNTAVLGSYIVVYEVSDSFGNTINATRTVDVVDTTSPVITLLGDNPQTIERMDAYTELGATALDNYDGDISASIVIDNSSVDTNMVGSYNVSYYVEDSSGNNDTVLRTVDVVDTIIPSITVHTPQDNTTYTSDIKINAESNEPVSWKYTVDDGVTNNTFAPNQTISLSNGNYNMFIYVTDLGGNENSTNVNFTLDKPIYKYSGGGGGGSCSTRWNCTKWSKWSLCENNIQNRSCLEWERVSCSLGVTMAVIEAGENQTCSFAIVQAEPSPELEPEPAPSEPEEEQQGLLARITGGMVGFAGSGTGLLTIITILVILGAWGAVHYKRTHLKTNN